MGKFLRGSIPTFIRITHGRISDVSTLDEIPFEAGAFYVLDRGYLHFQRLYKIQQANAFFVTRAWKNTQYARTQSRPVDKSTGLLCDQTIRLTGVDTHRTYPIPLRRIRYVDDETAKRLVFLTNNFRLAPLHIARLYRSRWRVELFFRWIKQHLRIKAFFGYSENAVRTQIWSAVAVYVLIAIVRKRLGLDISLYTFLQVLSVSLFEKTPILQAFQRTNADNQQLLPANQLKLFYF